MTIAGVSGTAAIADLSLTSSTLCAVVLTRGRARLSILQREDSRPRSYAGREYAQLITKPLGTAESTIKR